ncbi:MAG: cytochrome P450 [Vicinamibacterales bacterium]
MERLYPPYVAPARQPLRFPFNLTKLLDNNLEIIPDQAYDDAIVVAPGPPRMAFITSPDLIKELLLTRHDEFPKGGVQVEVLKPIFGNAMVSSEGDDWRWQRRVAAPLFRHDELLQYAPVMSAAAEGTVRKWLNAPGTVHPLHTDMMRAAFHVISNTMLVGGAAEMLGAIEKGHADYYRAANWWVLYTLLGLPHWLPRPGGQAMRAHEARMRLAVSDLVRERRDEATRGDDLLARLLQATDPETGRAMDNTLVVDNIVSFLMAGYDTTAFSLTWTLYLVSQSPEWEARIVEEVQRVAGTGPVCGEHVERLVVVQQVLSESMRLFPTAPIIVRDFVTDAKVDGVTIPAGTIGIIPIYAVHRHRRLWRDPNCFDPSRFAPDAAHRPTRYEFMPFGAGPRICIGAAFAMIETTIMLATFVRAARFEAPVGFRPEPSGRMFLLPKNGMPLRVTAR